MVINGNVLAKRWSPNKPVLVASQWKFMKKMIRSYTRAPSLYFSAAVELRCRTCWAFQRSNVSVVETQYHASSLLLNIMLGRSQRFLSVEVPDEFFDVSSDSTGAAELQMFLNRYVVHTYILWIDILKL